MMAIKRLCHVLSQANITIHASLAHSLRAQKRYDMTTEARATCHLFGAFFLFPIQEAPGDALLAPQVRMGDDANGGFGRGCAEAPAPRLQSEVQRPAALTPLERGKCTAHLKQDMATEARVLPLVRCQDGFAHNTICITVAWLPTQGSCHLFGANVWALP